jgi:tetratricopeptide (TPR) repeat protein
MNCSATKRFARVSGASRPRVVLTCVALAATCTVAGAADVADLDDAASRAQYAWYTGDIRALEEVVGLIDGLQLDNTFGAAKSYQLAYSHWKLADLYAQSLATDKSAANAKWLAGKAAQACVRDADAARTADPSMSEVYAIEAVCDSFAPTAYRDHDPPGCARHKSLRTALTMTPDNPRVRLIEAWCSQGAGNDPASLERWRSVVATFEAAPPSRPGKPDWGHVEALTMLGEAYLQRGDAVAARDALERALVLAPDYREAQRLLQTAATRPR